MLDLLFGLPGKVWGLLALIVLVPLALGLLGFTIARRRHLSIAIRLASRGVAIMGLGFGVLAIVATLFVLQTGLQELRQRHVAAVVELAATISAGHAQGPDSVALGRELALFRAVHPEVGPAIAWDLACRATCLSVSADPLLVGAAQAWALRAIATPPPAGSLRTVTLGGELHLVVPGVLRDPAGTPEGHVLIAVRAGWVADQALRAATVLVALAYALLISVWWITRRGIAASVATRVTEIASRLRAADAKPVEPEPLPRIARDELAMLDGSVRQHITHTIEQLRDADQRTADARALAARMEATATLAAGVAHDFNNLMTGVMANAEVLRQDLPSATEAHGTLDTMIECASRGGQLAQQLLAFARGGKYQPVVVDLNALVRETLRVEAHARAATITLRQEFAPDLLRVEADPTQISQVVSNLHRNAVEALRGEPAGTITIRTRNVPDDGERPSVLADMPAGAYVALDVDDTGSGMSTETRARIFEPFFTTKDGGRGMGLAAAYGIVTHHGGQIEVASERGRGTTFTVYLPGTTAEAAVPAPRSVPLAGRGVVLFVDDEVSILTATQRLLERSGYKVLTAESGHDAIQIARNAAGPIDVILLDMRMPGMSGAEAFGPLVTAQPQALVIICSGYELDAAARDLMARGAVAFVHKPFRVEELVSEIERAQGRTAPIG
ncbi:MAG: response regulator [Gemmatimonadota bacterium]|nr:response regulator [Gemmatimonadota bacterium]